jgi:hypothetical protein
MPPAKTAHCLTRHAALVIGVSIDMLVHAYKLGHACKIRMKVEIPNESPTRHLRKSCIIGALGAPGDILEWVIM